jgi:hypothetical protein
MGIKGFNTLLVNALQDEVSAGYQQYTVEHSLLAFIFDLVRNKEDAQLLLREWSGLRARTFLPSYLENDQYMPSRNHEVLSKTLNECIVRLTSATHELPYKNPANTGQVPQWITQPDGSRVKCRTFPDCVETSIRHIFNYSLGHTGMRVFKKEAIRDRVRAMFPNEGQLRGDDRLAELEDFYQTIHDPNDATGFARSQWNLVTFGLNSEDEMNSPHHVIYAHLKDLPNSGNNIRSNVCNTLKTIGGILGIRAATVMEDINDLDDVLARLNDLLSLINDSNTYKLQLVTADINPGQDFKSFESSVVIDITVILKNKYSNGSHYTFAMNNLAGHSFIMVLNNKDSTIYTGFNGISGPERNLFSYFFGGYEGQSLYSHVFSLPFLGKFNSMLTNAVRDYENIRDANLQEALQTVFGKVASRISLAHTEVASDLYQSILLACNFNNTTYQIVRHAACDPDTLPPDLENVTLHLSQDEAQLFDMSHNNGFTTSLALSGAISQIIGEGRLPTHIKSLKLTLLGRAMEHLDLTHFSELTSLELYCASLNGFKPPVNGKLKSYTIEDQIYET